MISDKELINYYALEKAIPHHSLSHCLGTITEGVVNSPPVLYKLYMYKFKKSANLGTFLARGFFGLKVVKKEQMKP